MKKLKTLNLPKYVYDQMVQQNMLIKDCVYLVEDKPNRPNQCAMIKDSIYREYKQLKDTIKRHLNIQELPEMVNWSIDQLADKYLNKIMQVEQLVDENVTLISNDRKLKETLRKIVDDLTE